MDFPAVQLKLAASMNDGCAMRAMHVTSSSPTISSLSEFTPTDSSVLDDQTPLLYVMRWVRCSRVKTRAKMRILVTALNELEIQDIVNLSLQPRS
jgi:hypothetical protein